MNIDNLLNYFGLGPTHFGDYELKHALEKVGIKTQVVWSSDEKFLRNRTISCEPIVLGFKLFKDDKIIVDSLSNNSIPSEIALLIIASLYNYVIKLPMFRFFFPQTIATIDDRELVGDILMHPIALFFDKSNQALPHTTLITNIYRMEVWEASGLNSYVPDRVIEAISLGNFGYLKTLSSPKLKSSEGIYQMAIPRKGIDTQIVLRLLSKAIHCKINVIVSPFIRHLANTAVPLTIDIIEKELSNETTSTISV
jgi:hypothetical protein